MCLIALAHGASDRYPLVIAANRDEEHDRATRPAHFWDDAPDILGGRDALHGGSWLAIARNGRFAAVTNLRRSPPRSRSRGLLVSSFVQSEISPETFAATVFNEASEYAGFHLLIGEIGGSIVYVTGGEEAVAPIVLERGIYGFSNAGGGEHWPKVDVAIAALREALTKDSLSDELLRFLATTRHSDRVEDEVFIVGDRYGTRSSTVVIATMDEILFAEQNYARGGIVVGEPHRFRIVR